MQDPHERKRAPSLNIGFFLDLAVIIIAAKSLGLLMRKIHIPQVVGEIIAGLLIGPNVLHLVDQSDFLSQMAELGVIMLMFVAGLETDLKEMKRTGPISLFVAAMGVLVPLAGGFLLYSCLYGFSPVGSDAFFEAVFIGTIITATSVSITVETLREMGKLKGKVGTTILSAAIIDDVLGILLLTFVIGFKNPAVRPLTVVFNTILFFLAAAGAGILLYWIFKWLDKRYPQRRRIPIFGFAVCLLFAFAAEHFFGIADITGAYVAGIIFCNIRDSDYIARKIDVGSYMLFSPIFFASIGLKTEIHGIDASMLVFSVLFVVVALGTKIVGCGLAAKACRFSWADSMKVGVGMMTRGEVALIVAQKGLEVGVVDPVYFTAVILLIVVSSVATPLALKALFTKMPPVPHPSQTKA